MPAPGRVLLAGGAVAVLEAAAGSLALAAYGPIRISLFLFSCALATTLVSVVLFALVARPRASGGEGPGGVRTPSDDSGSPPGTDPDWWPEFERDFRAHLEDRELTAV
jgi:hypothetical protein